MLEQFDQAVRGMKAGQSKTFPLQFPADYHGKDVAGKEADFLVTLKKVEAQHLPEVNEALAKSLGIPDGTVEALRADVKKNLEREVRFRVLARNKAAGMDAIAASAELDTPEALVQSELERMIEAARADLKQRGIKDAEKAPIPEEYFKPQAERRVRLGLVLAELVQQVILYADKTEYLFKDEAVLAYILMVTNFDNDISSALSILDRTKLDPLASPLISYVFAHLAIKNFQNDRALEYLLASPTGKDYYPFHYLHFLTGLTKLRRLDSDADVYLLKYISNHKGLHFVKECYQKLAWAELIKNNVRGYQHYMNLLKSSGTQVIDEDKQAQREAIQTKMPNVHLLKARLLFDEGYFSKAESLILANKSALANIISIKCAECP